MLSVKSNDIVPIEDGVLEAAEVEMDKALLNSEIVIAAGNERSKADMALIAMIADENFVVGNEGIGESISKIWKSIMNFISKLFGGSGSSGSASSSVEKKAKEVEDMVDSLVDEVEAALDAQIEDADDAISNSEKMARRREAVLMYDQVENIKVKMSGLCNTNSFQDMVNQIEQYCHWEKMLNPTTYPYSGLKDKYLKDGVYIQLARSAKYKVYMTETRSQTFKAEDGTSAVLKYNYDKFIADLKATKFKSLRQAIVTGGKDARKRAKTLVKSAKGHDGNETAKQMIKSAKDIKDTMSTAKALLQHLDIVIKTMAKEFTNSTKTFKL